MFNNNYMEQAYLNAIQAFNTHEVPVGAVITYKNKIIASSYNQMHHLKNPIAHAEINVIQQACTYLNEGRLTECDIYVTLEPCPMCAHALLNSRIRRIYFGAYDHKGGGIEHGPRIFQHYSHSTEIYGGMMESKCKALIQLFFQNKR